MKNSDVHHNVHNTTVITNLFDIFLKYPGIHLEPSMDFPHNWGMKNPIMGKCIELLWKNGLS